MNEPEFVDELPRSPRGAGTRFHPWMEILEPLMAQPKKWAIVARKGTANTAGSTAVNLKRRVVVIPEGAWEFVARTVEGEHRVYARYLGNGDAS